MEKIIWHDRFNLQIEVIDRQHRRLVDIMLFLKEWLVEHIVKTDGAFGDFLKNTNAG